MNAVMRKCEQAAESALMPANERDDQAIQLAELRADVRHIQSDTTEIKADLRATNQRLDSLAQRMDEKFESVRKEIASAKIWAFGLYLALAGSLLYVLARGFKWL